MDGVVLGLLNCGLNCVAFPCCSLVGSTAVGSCVKSYNNDMGKSVVEMLVRVCDMFLNNIGRRVHLTAYSGLIGRGFGGYIFWRGKTNQQGNRLLFFVWDIHIHIHIHIHSG